MGYGIHSEDMVAMSLLLADGDTAIETNELVARVERYQRRIGDRFGVTDEDMHGALWRLGFEERLLPSALEVGWGEAQRKLDAIPLARFIPLMLLCHDVWFNDEGEHWWRDTTIQPSPRNRLLREYFSARESPAPQEVVDFLVQAGWTPKTLPRYTEGAAWLIPPEESPIGSPWPDQIIPTEIIVRACLAAVQGDAAAPLDDALSRIETIWDVSPGKLGLHSFDLRLALYWLGVERDLFWPEAVPAPGVTEALDAFAGQPLRKWIPPLLDYRAVQFDGAHQYWLRDRPGDSVSADRVLLRRVFA